MKTKLTVIIIATIIIGTTAVTTLEKFNLGGGTMDLDPDPSPRFALDFAGGLLYHIVLPFLLLFGIILSSFPNTVFYSKKKKYFKQTISISSFGRFVTIFFSIPNFISSLQSFAIILSRPEQIRTWVF